MVYFVPGWARLIYAGVEMLSGLDYGVLVFLTGLFQLFKVF